MRSRKAPPVWGIRPADPAWTKAPDADSGGAPGGGSRISNACPNALPAAVSIAVTIQTGQLLPSAIRSLSFLAAAAL
jgi:hypothetical protein